MFRSKERNGIVYTNFGIGSTFGENSGKKFLVVELTENIVSLICLRTFSLLDDIGVKVEDATWLTQKEALQVVNLANEQCTFHESDLNALGLKDWGIR